VPTQRAEILDYLVDKRVSISGRFDRFSTIFGAMRDKKTALMQDCYAHVEGKDIDLGHIWLQNVEPLLDFDLDRGDRLIMTTRVTEYKKSFLDPDGGGYKTEIQPSFCWPEDIEIQKQVRRPTEDVRPLDAQHQNRLHQAVEEKQPSQQQTEQVSAFKLIGEVKRLARMAGGMDELALLIEALKG
jgi:hypothetical protein